MPIHDKSYDVGSCLVCESRDLLKVEGFAALQRITSDCRPFSVGGDLSVCGNCGAVQKRPTATWMREIGEIYSAYAPYYQSGGDEQIVFDKASGQPRRRSDVLMERLASSQMLPTKGHALDVGCGNGVTLASINSVFSDWTLNGYELGSGVLSRLMRIPRFEKLYTESLATIYRTFDLVTMIHSLEHFPDPKDALDKMLKIVGDGCLFIEVCNVEQNPFDILVADHLMHFDPASLSLLLNRAGFAVQHVSTDWVPKEISLVAQKGDYGLPHTATCGQSGAAVLKRISSYVKWLQDLVTVAYELAKGHKSLGIFGTSIAATWLASHLDTGVSFFVDEDESRVGKTHFGRPIIRPVDVPKESVVYLALAPAIAQPLSKKLAGLSLNLVLPPNLHAVT